MLIIPGKSARDIEAKWAHVWEACLTSERESNSRYSQSKTEAMFVARDSRAIRPPATKLANDAQVVRMSEHIKYLDLFFDNKMSFPK